MPPPPEKILLIRPSALGDVCRSVPVLARLKRRWPEARIDWLVQEEFAPAVAAHPDLGAVVPFPRRRLRGWWRRPRAARETVGFLGSLRAGGYDVAIDCQGLLRSGIFARATGARERVGFAAARELGWLGLNRRVDVPDDAHAVERMMALVDGWLERWHSGAKSEESDGAAPDMRLYVRDEDRTALEPSLASARGRYALVAPTSRWPGKRWPAERFALLCAHMLNEGMVERIAVVGAGSERDQCGPLLELAAREERIVDLVGRTSVGGLMAAVEGSGLVIANDSAALHMAVGFDRPVVALFGPTRVDRVGPWRREADVIQHIETGERMDHKSEAAGRRMMERISLEEVLEKTRTALRRAGERIPGEGANV